MNLNNKKWIIITLSLIVLILIFWEQLMPSIKDSKPLQKQMISIADKSHWDLLNRGEVVAMEFRPIDEIWSDSIQFLIVLRDKLESDSIYLPEKYNANNSIIFIPKSIERDIKGNSHIQNWKIVTDTTKMLDFLFYSDSSMMIFKIRRNINGQFEFKK